jgi:leader peptidase (prepilin peptidase) / N-methyltransferase
MTAPWPLVGLMAALGLTVGFFLDALTARTQRSQQGHLTARYPIAEIGTAVLFAAVTMRFGLTAELPAYLYLAAIGVSLVVIDFDMRRLPDSMLLPSYIVTVVLLMPAGAAAADWYTAVRAIGGMLALLALYFALAMAYPNGLGFGDVKLAGLVGLYLGWLSWNALFVTAIGSLLIACAGGSAAMLTQQPQRGVAVPIAPCLVSAAVLALFVTVPLSNWYSSLLPA